MRRVVTIFGACAALLIVAAGWLYTLGPYRRIAIEQLPGAEPAVLGRFGALPAVLTAEDWRLRRTRLLDAFAENVYGPAPAPQAAVVEQKERISSTNAAAVDGVEQWRVRLADGASFHVVMVMPTARPRAVLILQNYCGNQAAFPDHPPSIAPPRQSYPRDCASPVFRPFHQALFGEWIDGPPLKQITERGYALVLFYGGDLVPDNAADAPRALARLNEPGAGALSAWAWMISEIIDVLERDERFISSPFVAWGQSRYGKAALLAGARDERIAAVVALQSGRGGDALTRHRSGESVSAITTRFPYWFTPRFADYATVDPPVDQHQLLALIAPRPLLLGYARRDGWSDPVGGVAALSAAQSVYALLHAPLPRYFVRDGRHGVTDADWDATLAFLDSAFER